MSGPEMPPSFSDNELGALSTTGSKQLNVPSYDWHHGCGPTAVGMLLGYYDARYGTGYLGNSQLESIASSEHYYDYSEPLDSLEPMPLPDKSEYGGYHSDNSIADVMRTSFSKDGMKYGWSYTTQIAETIESYTSLKGNKIEAQLYDSFTLQDLKNEIDNDRPFIVFINAGNNGYADHFATVAGYNGENLIINTGYKSTVETPLLSASEQLGINAVILTTNPETGDGEVTSNSMPGFELIFLILSIIIVIKVKKWEK